MYIHYIYMLLIDNHKHSIYIVPMYVYAHSHIDIHYLTLIFLLSKSILWRYFYKQYKVYSY